jgi:C-terminal processing protease CtpA/Prc
VNLTLQDREKIFAKVDRLVRTKHVNPGLNGIEWGPIAEARRQRILACQGAEDFEREVHEAVSQLKTSHTGFFHRSVRNIPARHAINATLQRCTLDGVERWVFLDVHAGGPAHGAGVEPGDILLTIDDQEVIPPDPPVFHLGEATQINVRKRDGKALPVTVDIPSPHSRKHPVIQPRPVSFSKLPDGIGLLTVTMFPGAVGIDLARDLDHAIGELQSCDRLIVDLRGNTGGGIGGLRLMSYLTASKIPVGYSLTRRRAEKGYRKEELTRFGKIPARKSTLVWLALRYGLIDKSIAVVTEGLGPQKFHGRVVILINRHSASAAEMVAAFAKENGLAKLVGTRSAGRLLSGTAFKVGKGYMLGLPVAAYWTWGGALIEGKGIEPDEPVDLSYDDLKAGRDRQMEKAVEVVSAM